MHRYDEIHKTLHTLTFVCVRGDYMHPSVSRAKTQDQLQYQRVNKRALQEY
jgi:hypothetical protein